MILILFLLLLFCHRLLTGSIREKIFTLGLISILYFCLTFYSWQAFNLPLMNWRMWLLPSLASPLNAILASFYALILADIILFYQWLKRAGYIIRVRTLNWRSWIYLSIASLFTFIGFLLFSSSHWAINYFDNLEIDQIIYTLSQPLTGSDPGQIKEFVVDPLLFGLTGTVIVMSTFYYLSTHSIRLTKTKWFPSKNGLHFNYILSSSIILLALGVTLGVRQIGYASIKAYFFETTELYDTYYQNPEKVKLTFPDQKRNLIYIFLESMETSYASTDVGGIQSENLIPNLTDLAQTQGVNFSNTELLGGMLPIPSASHTASSMVAQTSGLPLRTSSGLHVNSYGKDNSPYLPGAYSLGEILKNEGYNRTLLMGSDAAFAGRNNYFTQHGDYTILDYNWAKETKRIPDDYYIWWGYEDAKLFDYAKETLTDLSNKPEPFNFTMLTADTHFEDGLLTDATPNLFNDQYSNVIHYSDDQVMALLSWIKEQPFYENTTVILCGDHLTMDKDFFEKIDPDYQRTVYNVILNSGKENYQNKNRLFSAVDMFPTTLAALGVEIEGDRLGIGTNLFSTKPTVMEEIGYDNFYNELSKRSIFYENKIIQGTDRVAGK